MSLVNRVLLEQRTVLFNSVFLSVVVVVKYSFVVNAGSVDSEMGHISGMLHSFERPLT